MTAAAARFHACATVNAMKSVSRSSWLCVVEALALCGRRIGRTVAKKRLSDFLSETLAARAPLSNYFELYPPLNSPIATHRAKRHARGLAHLQTAEATRTYQSSASTAATDPPCTRTAQASSLRSTSDCAECTYSASQTMQSPVGHPPSCCLLSPVTVSAAAEAPPDLPPEQSVAPS